MRTLNILTTALCMLIAVAVYGQNIEKREIDSFDKVSVFGKIDVVMKKGNTEGLEIKARNVKLEEITTEVEDKLLKIRMNSNLFNEDVEVKITLTYKEIREVSANAAAEIVVNETVSGDKLSVDATSGARVKVDVDLNAIDLKAYQGAHIDITGKVKLQESLVNTGGVLAGPDLKCDEVFIKLNTGGKAEFTVNNLIDANVNTGAVLSYFGKPEKENIKTTLGGNVNAWDK